MAADALSLRVASVVGATIGGFAKIDGEYMKIVNIISPIVHVRERGSEGGTAILHDTGASVTFGIGSEMPLLGTGELVPPPTEDRAVISVGSDQTIPWNSLRRDTIVTITKPSAAAIILEAPNAAADGVTLTIVSASNFAHIITATGLIEDGVTGGAKNTLTFPAFAGASVTLLANRAKWTVLAKNTVT
jgi:hypothetical protein